MVSPLVAKHVDVEVEVGVLVGGGATTAAADVGVVVVVLIVEVVCFVDNCG